MSQDIKVKEMKRAIYMIRTWARYGQSSDSKQQCPKWGIELVNQAIDLIDKIFEQRELGRNDAMKGEY